jgi:hypothetical protein
LKLKRPPIQLPSISELLASISPRQEKSPSYPLSSSSFSTSPSTFSSLLFLSSSSPSSSLLPSLSSSSSSSSSSPSLSLSSSPSSSLNPQSDQSSPEMNIFFPCKICEYHLSNPPPLPIPTSTLQLPGISLIKRKKRQRRSSFQTNFLEGQFLINPTPSRETCTKLGGYLNMTPRCVQIWFQNRRAKIRRIMQMNQEPILDLPCLDSNKSKK